MSNIAIETDFKLDNVQERKNFYQPSSSIHIKDKNDVNEVKKFAFAVCREYLSGAWKNIDFGDFVVERISYVNFKFDAVFIVFFSYLVEA